MGQTVSSSEAEILTTVSPPWYQLPDISKPVSPDWPVGQERNHS